LPARRILLLRAGAIGDFILTLPALAALRAAWPEARIVLFGHPRTHELALAAHVVDEVRSIDAADVARLHIWPAAISRDFSSLLKSFDLAVSWLSDPDEVVCRNLRNEGIPIVAACSPKPAFGHACEHLLSPLRELGMKVPAHACPRLDIESERETAGSGRLVVLHPGSGSESKNWPLDRFLELAGRIESDLGCACAFSAGEADERVAGRLRKEAPARVLPAMSLLNLARRLRGGAGYVGNDSGITHLAAAAGCPTVAVFGPSDSAVWGPRGGRVRIVAAKDRTADALRQVPVDTVFSALRAAIASA
jgi:ADP-heptose:LPS heptosyltransferase